MRNFSKPGDDYLLKYELVGITKEEETNDVDNSNKEKNTDNVSSSSFLLLYSVWLLFIVYRKL